MTTMDLMMFLLSSLMVCKVELASLLSSHQKLRRALLPVECPMESYLDPNLGPNGRCQPCSEICASNAMGEEDECEKHKDRCPETYKLYRTALATATPDHPSSELLNPGTIVAVAVVTVVLALIMTTVLIIYLCKHHKGVCRNCCCPCVHGIRVVIPVPVFQACSKEEMCVSGVTKSLDGTSVALVTSLALLTSPCQEEEATSYRQTTEDRSTCITHSERSCFSHPEEVVV